MEWKVKDRKYENGEDLYLGIWVVGSICWCINTSDRWGASCELPGIKKHLGYYPDKEIAKKEVENAVNYWLKNLPNGLKICQTILRIK